MGGRMAVRISPNSAKIKITSRPTVNRPAIVGTKMSFTGTSIQAAGQVTLAGDRGDTPTGWTAGFLQAQWIETNWCFYRGQNNGDGSIFIQRARPPARPAQACRDCVDGSPVNQIFYSAIPAHGEIAAGGAGGAFPPLNVRHFDQPSDDCNLVETNSKTLKPNFLQAAQLEFHFCTILTVRDPRGAFHHQLSFYWEVHWQATFEPLSFTVPPSGFSIHVVPAGTGQNTGGIISGAPVDRRFTGVITAPQSQSCNDVFRAARAAVGGPHSPNRHERPTWSNFDVTAR